jgi:hypothetical protein
MNGKRLSLIPEKPCGEKTVDQCSAERPRYFPRQLITPSDLTLEAEYFRNKLRRHNRLMHGWGVVCGAQVCPVWCPEGGGMQPWKVVIRKGYILGPFGDEIVIENERIVDVRASGVTGMPGDPAGEAVDPWCSEVFIRRESGPLYVAVKYQEIMTRPVKVQPVGCSCDDSHCEYSRWCDGYEIGVLSCYPDCQAAPAAPPGGSIPECPACPTNPWVVLAKVEIDPRTGEITLIDNCSCRRLVISHGNSAWQCTTPACDLDMKVTNNKEFQQGVTDIEVVVAGKDIQPGAKVDLGGGITIKAVVSESGQLTFTADVDADAATGVRTLTILNPDCTWCRRADAIDIKAKKLPSKKPPVK